MHYLPAAVRAEEALRKIWSFRACFQCNAKNKAPTFRKIFLPIFERALTSYIGLQEMKYMAPSIRTEILGMQLSLLSIQPKYELAL
jgi:hypothetical protein